MGRDERTERWINNEVLGDDGVSSVTDSETGTSHDVGDDLAARFGDLVETQSPSGVSEADFTSGFTRATHVFVLENVIPATDGVDLILRTSSDGGSSYDSGANDYDYKAVIATGDSPLVANAKSESEIVPAFAVGSATDEPGVSGELRILNADNGSAWTQVTYNLSSWEESDGLRAIAGSGVRKENGVVDAVRFAFSSGNIESGTIRHFGYR